MVLLQIIGGGGAGGGFRELEINQFVEQQLYPIT
jgi:hypothetical protein